MIHKYRSWDGKTMNYTPEACLDGNSELVCGYYDDSGYLNSNDDILMQFTGLKDKNKKEIYQGDIISDGEIIGLVEWIKDKCCFDVQIDGEYFSDYLCDYIDGEVIGNIYENPDLISSTPSKETVK